MVQLLTMLRKKIITKNGLVFPFEKQKMMLPQDFLYPKNCCIWKHSLIFVFHKSEFDKMHNLSVKKKRACLKNHSVYIRSALLLRASTASTMYIVSIHYRHVTNAWPGSGWLIVSVCFRIFFPKKPFRYLRIEKKIKKNNNIKNEWFVFSRTIPLYTFYFLFFVCTCVPPECVLPSVIII